MKRLLTIFMILAQSTCFAQIDWKREILPISCLFVAGAMEGTAETLKWHYHKFERVHPNANADYFDPSRSWVNKYQNGDPLQGPKHFGSTTFLVWTTDGYHLARTMRSTLILSAILTAPDLKGQRWWVYLAKAAMYTAAYTAGFHLTYTLIYK